LANKRYKCFAFTNLIFIFSAKTTISHHRHQYFMRKVTFLCGLMVITMSAMSQYQFGIFAGPQITSAKYVIRSVKQSTSYKPGFHVGAGWKIPFENKLYFSPSAFYSMKGYKVKFNQTAFPPDTAAIDNNTRIHTVELAFLLQVDLGTGPNHFFAKAGPSLDFQLFGREAFNLKSNTGVKRDMPFSFGDYGRYAASMLLQFGYEMANGVFVNGQYTHGMGSINNADHGPRIRHRAFGLTVGKYLKKK
jgi:hypothetical protein